MLSQSQLEEVKQTWESFDGLFEETVAGAIPARRKLEIEEQVRADMKMEGLGAPGPRYGPEDFSLAIGRSDGIFAHRVYSRLAAEFSQSVAFYSAPIKEAVCVKFAYCRKRRSGELQGEGWTIAAGVSDALLTYLTSFPLPATTVGVYLVKKGILDELCGCAAEQKAGTIRKLRVKKPNP
jgi:hypothetical protein